MLTFALRGIGTCAKGSKIISKLLRSRETLKAADLVSENYAGVMQAVKNEGLQGIVSKKLRSGGILVNIPNIKRTGVVGVFPGGVMAPNGGLINNVALKFNAAGDCLQITGVQRVNGAIAGSTIRTPQGLKTLEQGGVKNPTEYLQVFRAKDSKGINHRYINKTNPFGIESEASVQQASAKVGQEVAQSTSNNSGFETVLERIRQKDPVVAESIEKRINCLLGNKRTGQEKSQAYMAEIARDFGKSDADLTAKVLEQRKIIDAENLAKFQREREEKIGEFLNKVESINPQLAEKFKLKANYLYEKDPERANQFFEGLMKRCDDGRTNLYDWARKLENANQSGLNFNFAPYSTNPFANESYLRSDDILRGTNIGDLSWNI